MWCSEIEHTISWLVVKYTDQVSNKAVLQINLILKFVIFVRKCGDPSNLLLLIFLKIVGNEGHSKSIVTEILVVIVLSPYIDYKFSPVASKLSHISYRILQHRVTLEKSLHDKHGWILGLFPRLGFLNNFE